MNAETFLDEAPALNADEFLADAPSAEDFLTEKPGAVAGTVNEFKRGLLSGQQQLLAAELAAAPKSPSMRQLRRAYVTAMGDPRYGLALNAAGDDRAKAQRVEDTLGPTAQVDRVVTAINANRKAIADNIAAVETEMQSLPQSEAMTEWSKADNSNWWQVLAKNPVEITAGIMAQSFPAMTPALAANMVAPGGHVGRALASGAGSFGVEGANAFLDSARQTGYDFTEPDQVRAFFDNPDAQTTAREFAAKRGVPIAVFDALTAGLAGRFVAPALKQGTAKVLAGTGKEILLQAAGGAAGETAAQVASGQKLSVKDIVAEALGEIASGPTEAVSNLKEGRASRAASAGPGGLPPAQPGRPLDDELPPAPPSANEFLSTPGQSDVSVAGEAATGGDTAKNVAGLETSAPASAPQQSAAGPVSPVPEDPRTIAAQMEALRNGKRSAVLITPGEAMPEVPGNMKSVALEGYGTMIYSPRVHKEETILQRAKEDKLGRILGYGVDRKPPAGAAIGVVTVRTPEGVEKQAVVTDEKNLESVTKAAEKVADPEDTVQLEPAQQVIADRLKTQDSRPPVTEAHLQQAREAVAQLRGEDIERAPDVIDDLENVTRGPIRVPAELTDVIDASRERIAEALHKKPWKRLSSAQRKTINQQLRVSTTEGIPADEATRGLGDKYADLTVDDLTNTVLDAAEGRLLERRKGDSKEVLQMAEEIAQAEVEARPAIVEDWDTAAATAQADRFDKLLTRAIEATTAQPGQVMEGVTGLPYWVTRDALNGLLRVIRATYRGTKNLAQAFQAGLEWLRAQNLPNYSETEIRAWLEQRITTTPEDDDVNYREFADQLNNAESGEPETAKLISNLIYERRTNESDAAMAARVLQAVGGPAAAVDVFTDGTNGLPGSVRMMLGQLIIKAFGVAGQHEAAARFYDETFAAHITETAQALQALNAFLALTPEGKVIWARRKIERARETLIAPVRPQLEEAQRQLEQANREGIEATTAAPDVQTAAREAVDTALEHQAQTPGTPLAEAIRNSVLDALVKAGLLTPREAEIVRLHLEGTADNSTLAEKLQRAGIPLHEERARAINELYKARTKTERERIKSWARRARQEQARRNGTSTRGQRATPQQDWIKKARSIPSREIEAAANKLRKALEPANAQRAPALQEFYQRLTTRLTALLPEQQRAGTNKLTDAQLIREVFNNPEKYADVWQQLGTEIRAKYGVEGMADLTNTLGELSPELLVQQTMESNLDRIIREQMQALRVQFGQLIRQHYTGQAATTATLKDAIVQSVGLKEADANKLALVVQKRFAQLVTAKKQAALEKLLKPVKRIARPQLIERLIGASNLGALSQEKFWQAVQANLDLPQWSNEMAERIRKQVDVIERTPADQIERKQKAQTELLNIIERAKGIDTLDLGLAFYITNILTGFTTHAKNLGSTFLNASGAIGSEAARAVATGHLDDIPLLLEAIGQGVKRGQLAARDVLRSGVVTGSRLGKVEAGRALELTQFGQRGGVPVRGKVTRAVLENRLASILNLWKYNFRLMAAEDLLFFKPAEEAKASLLAKRVARSEGLKGDAAQDRARQILGYGMKAVDTARAQAEQEGLTGAAASRRAAEILNNSRPLELREDARQFALRTTFNNEPYGAMGAVAQLLNRAKASENRKLRFAANLITPFTNIIANVVNESLNYTPVGALRARYNGDKIVGYNRAELTPQQQADLRAELYSKALVGTTLLAALALKAAGDLDDPDPDFAIYGAGPAAPADRMGLEAKGWLAHSLKIGDRYYSYANTPLAIPMAWLGGIYDRMRDARLFQNRSAQRTADSLPLMAASSAVGMGKVITEQSFMTGLMDVASMVSERSPEASGRGALKQAVRMASSVAVPNAVRQVDKFFDPTQYEQRDAEGILVNAIPFVRGAAGQPVLNALGLPVQSPLSRQFTSSQADADPLVKTLAESGNWPTLPDRNQIYPERGRTMTSDEFYAYVKGSGQIARKELADLVNDRGWKDLAPEDQAKLISETLSLSRQMWRADNGW